jgi:hypothetical protein
MLKIFSTFTQSCIVVLALLLLPSMSQAWEISGKKSIYLHDQTGAKILTGKIDFQEKGSQIHYSIDWDHKLMKDYFLSMREFKCLEGQVEILCQVPYPYKHPQSFSKDNYQWLEHSLLFMFKTPKNFGAVLWNGIYFKLELGPNGFRGEPQAIDLNLIAAPPEKLDVPPYGVTERNAIEKGARWFTHLTIE